MDASGSLAAEVHETHTGVVVLLGDKAYKAKKSLVTDFLDFSSLEARERACAHEIVLNSRLAPTAISAWAISVLRKVVLPNR